MPLSNRIRDLQNTPVRGGEGIVPAVSRCGGGVASGGTEGPPQRKRRISFPLKIATTLLSGLLFLTSSPSLFAITMSQIKSGVPGTGGGGEGSAPNLQNAGAASAALTAALTKKSQQQSAAIVAAMQKLQQQARASATGKLAGGIAVPNGLKTGGLEPYTGKNPDGSLKSGFDIHGNPVTATWNGASITASSDPTKAADPNYVNIQQNSQNAYLYWNSFNVGSQTTLNFDQSKGGETAGNWIAFNKVMSPSDPSHIFGKITAQGQVYILNQNGILFHAGSMVNVHSLVASTLPINGNLAGDALDGVTGRGIANNPDAQFLFSSLAIPSGRNDPNGFDPVKSASGLNIAPGDVTVEPGASIVSQVNAAGVGGLVALIGPNVRNGGFISTAGGQTILAAGLQVALLPHPSTDPSLRGMDVTVGAETDPSGMVVPLSGKAGNVLNSGLISMPEGDATLAGKTVTTGPGSVIDSSTSVALNGRIDLIASSGAVKNSIFGLAGPAYFQGATGLLDLGEGSLLRILPQTSSSASVVGASLALNSIVNLLGESIHVERNAVIETPGAAVTSGALSETGDPLASGVTLRAGQWFSPGASASQLLPSEGQIYLEGGAVIDAAGSADISIDSSQNYLTLQLRGSELANSPLQRNSPVRGKDLTVDARIAGTPSGQILYFPTAADAYAAYRAGTVSWIGTPLGNAAGFSGLIQRTAAQLTEAGGSVSLSAGDAVVMSPGSAINVSGGWTRYTGGSFATSKLTTADGRVIDISKATPDQPYSGILKDPPKAAESSYLNGASGGSLSIQAPTMALKGSLYGITTSGARQFRSSPKSGLMAPLASLSLSFQGQSILKDYNGQPANVTVSPYAPTVVFSAGGGAQAPAFSIDQATGLPLPLGAVLPGVVALSPGSLLSSGFGRLSITDHDGLVSLPSGSSITLPSSGSLSVTASRIEVAGSLSVPGGSVSLTADQVPYSLAKGSILIPDGTLQSSLQGVLVATATGNGLTRGELVYQYGSPLTDGTLNVLDPYNFNAGSSGPAWNAPVSQLSPYVGGRVIITRGGVIDTAGLAVDDVSGSSAPFELPVTLQGGSIKLSGLNVSVAPGSLLDVSGGAIQPAAGSLVYGDAGSLSILAGRDPQNPQMHGGALGLGGVLRGYAGPGKAAGSLTLGAPAFRIGGSSAPGTIQLQPSFFNQGGFSSFTLQGAGVDQSGGEVVPGILVAPGTSIHPVVSSEILTLGSGDVRLVPFLQASGLAPAVALNLNATGIIDPSFPAGQNLLVRGDLVFGAGASLALDPHLSTGGTSTSGSGGSVILSGMTASVQGSLNVPGGSITVTGTSGSFPVNYFNASDSSVNAPRVTVDLGPSAVLSTAGKILLSPDPAGMRQAFGAVLPGGSIVVSGDILAEAGSALDASGASGMLDLWSAQLGSDTRGIIRTRIDSAGGNIALSGGNALYTAARLSARSGGPTAPGGTLTVSSGRFYDANDSTTVSRLNGWDPTLAVSQSAPSIPAGFTPSGNRAIGAVLPPSFGIPEGGGHVSVGSFAGGGFDSLNLKGSIQFVTTGGSVSITVPGSLRVADKGTLAADGQVTLSSSYIAIGTPFLAPLAPNTLPPVGLESPSSGAGVIHASGRLLDVGYLSFQNIGSAVLDAGGGQIRGDGVLDIAGNLTLTASLISPVTGTTFQIDASPGASSPGLISVKGAGQASALPLSAAGSLRFYAGTISQGGSLAAPFGSITLGWDGTGTAPVDPATGSFVPVAGQISMLNGSLSTVGGVDPFTGRSLSIPYGVSSDGTDWIDPSGTTITSSGIPTRSVTLSSLNLTTEAGSVIDVSGGGKMTASQWISGLGGTIDYLAQNSGSYAVLPGIQSLAAPTGYSDGNLAVGSRISLSGIPGLPGGSYTLLPAIYATLPGAYLVTPSSKPLAGSSVMNPDGSWLVAGTRFNGLDSAASASPLRQAFEVDSPSVVASKVQYQIHSADGFFTGISSSGRNADAGHLVLKGDLSMSLQGGISGRAASKGAAATVDVTGVVPIWIGPSSLRGSAPAGDIVLTDSTLSSWNAGSLLIGGIRHGITQDGSTPVTVDTTSVTVADGAILTGQDLMLAASEKISLGQGDTLAASGGTLVPDKKITLGGDGAFVRVSSDPSVSLGRSSPDALSKQLSGLTDPAGIVFTPTLSVGSGNNPTIISGASAILDSSALSSVAPGTVFKVDSAVLNAGSLAVLTGVAGGTPLDSSDASSLVLGGALLSSLVKSSSLSLGSYSAISFYGAGTAGSAQLGTLALHAAELRGFNLAGGALSVAAGSIILDNSYAGTAPGPATQQADGTIHFRSSGISLGQNTVAVDQFSSVLLDASSGIVVTGSGALTAGGIQEPSDLYLNTPVLSASGSAPAFTLRSSAGFHLANPAAGTPGTSSGIGNGGRITVRAEYGISLDSSVLLPSGSFSAETTLGDINVGTASRSVISVAGASKSFNGNLRTADAGSVVLAADAGNVTIGSHATLDLSAQGAASAGELHVTAVADPYQSPGFSGLLNIRPGAVLKAQGGASGGNGGIFSVDASSLIAPSAWNADGSSQLSWVEPVLSGAGFTQSQSFRIRSGDILMDDTVRARAVSVSADAGSIDVTGGIDASGVTGGNISLQASGSLILEPSARLSVHAATYDASGKGGSILLAAGSEVNGGIDSSATLDLQPGSTADLGVTATPRTIGTDPSSGLPETDQFGGVLHLKAPLTVNPSGSVTGIRVTEVSSTVQGASSVALEGSLLYDITGRAFNGGDLSASLPLVQGVFRSSQSVLTQVNLNIRNFYGSVLQNNLQARFLGQLEAANPSFRANSFNMAPGVEVINRQGNLTLGSDWNLAQLRAGGSGSPGFLTFRSSGSILLKGSLSDGFTSSAYDATLLSRNRLLPGNFQSWSYLLTAGSDLSASAPSTVISGGSGGNVELGIPFAQGGPNLLANGNRFLPNGPDAQTAQAVAGYYQVIRTGTGDIGINASGNIDLWNQFASIYTAGTQVLDPTLGGTFDTPSPNFTSQNQIGLGSAQQTAPSVQYSYSGGNVTLTAGNDIQHVARAAGSGRTIADSVRQLPSNWLYRRGAMDPSNPGRFLVLSGSGEVESTTWWVDFSNFFEGVGALGGGNISMNAAGNIANIDAVIPTSFRMPGHLAPGNGLPGNLLSAGSVAGVELGGGDLSVRTGNNLDAGVYYVERGSGSIRSGGSIITNPTRDPQAPNVTKQAASIAQSDLPTTLFLGKSTFDVTATGDVILGPAANVFLTPEGINNGYRYQDYFSTYSADAGVSVLSLGGGVTLREATSTPGGTGSLLQLWYRQMTPPAGQGGIYPRLASFYQPWTWLDVSSVSDLGSQSALLPPTLDAVSFQQGITLQGNLTLAPSATGNLSLLAATGIQGLSLSGSRDGTVPVWASSTITVSDASPSKIPGAGSPLAMISTLSGSARNDPGNYAGPLVQSFVSGISSLFAETGSFTGEHGVLENKLNLHDASLLHAGDQRPVLLLAEAGDISGLQLFSPKRTEISAAGSITDVGLYIQNLSPSDVSVVTAGGDVIPYDPTSALQLKAQSAMSMPAQLQSGDIQISGPGTMEVLAGGNIDLGNGPNNPDGTGVGITSIGNSRNPGLPFGGADVIAASGMSLPLGLSSALENAQSLITRATALPDAPKYYSELLVQVSQGGNDDLVAALKSAGSLDGIEMASLTDDQKTRLALALFSIVLRDSGRDHNIASSPGYGSYRDGESAIPVLLGRHSGHADINLRTQSIRTLSGGSITLLSPGGGVSLAPVIPPKLNVLTPPGIVTEHGGGISVYTRDNVSIGIGRIFTLRGGDIMMWSDKGNIAAGSSAKTVATAPPTRVLVDPQSGNVQTDLAGLATGGGIGVLDTVAGIAPGSVDLIAPSGIIDAGDAGIRSSGTLNLAATKVLNADNIAAVATVGAPASSAAAAPPAAAPPAAAPPAAASAAAAANNGAADTASKNNAGTGEADQAPSIYTIDVLGYGGGDGEDDGSKSADAGTPPVQASL